VPDPAGGLWFTEEAAGQVGAISATGIITEFGLRPNERADWLAIDALGRLWVTGTDRNDVLELKPRK